MSKKNTKGTEITTFGIQSHRSSDVANNIVCTELQEGQKKIDELWQIESMKKDAAEQEKQEQIASIYEGINEKLDHLIKTATALQLQLLNREPKKGIGDEEYILGELPQGEGSQPRTQFLAKGKAIIESSENQVYTHVPRVDFPKFDGSKPRSWMLKCDEYFKLVPDTPDEQRIILASMYFEGKAALWYQNFSSKHVLVNWKQFLEVISARFEDLKEAKIVEEFNQLKHIGDYMDYVGRFKELKESMMMFGQGIFTETYFMTSFLTGLSEDVRAAINLFSPTSLEQIVELGKNHVNTQDAITKKIKGNCRSCTNPWFRNSQEIPLPNQPIPNDSPANNNTKIMATRESDPTLHLKFSLIGCRFIKEHGILSKPLTLLLKKDGFKWSHGVDQTFSSLKDVVTSAHRWKHYMLGNEFVVQIDQQDLKLLLNQKLMTPFKQRWITELLVLDYKIHYWKGCENRPGALPRLHDTTNNYEALTSNHVCVISYEGDSNFDKTLIYHRDDSTAYLHYINTNGLWRCKGILAVGYDKCLRPKILVVVHILLNGRYSGENDTYVGMKKILYRLDGEGLVKTHNNCLVMRVTLSCNSTYHTVLNLTSSQAQLCYPPPYLSMGSYLDTNLGKVKQKIHASWFMTQQLETNLQAEKNGMNTYMDNSRAEKSSERVNDEIIPSLQEMSELNRNADFVWALAAILDTRLVQSETNQISQLLVKWGEEKLNFASWVDQKFMQEDFSKLNPWGQGSHRGRSNVVNMILRLSEFGKRIKEAGEGGIGGGEEDQSEGLNGEDKENNFLGNFGKNLMWEDTKLLVQMFGKVDPYIY
ncbi:hypothetical protein C2S51_025408 [Perilla frutescens var. frutescens]|nr:hypothetical protein C2S51_025408 [Perilla frutescens var. frutescens]